MAPRLKPWTVKGSRYLVRERFLTARVADWVSQFTYLWSSRFIVTKRLYDFLILIKISIYPCGIAQKI